MLPEFIPVNYVCVFAFFALVVIAYYRWSFRYWKVRNVPFLEPSIPFGNVNNPILRKEPMYVELAKYYRKMKSLGHKHAGIYVITKPVYLVLESGMIKSVLVKDFDSFMNHGLYHNERDDPLSAHLFAVEDSRWRLLRAKLTPTFTSGKMKMMFATILDCGRSFGEAFDSHCNAGKAVDIKKIWSNYIVDVIGSSGFGIECNCFENPNSEFVRYGKKAFADYAVSLKIFIVQYWQKASRKLGFKLISEDVAKFFTNLVRTTVDFRDRNNTRRSDFLQILMDMRGTEHELTPNEMAAQVYMFFFAGFESISLTITFLMYELALHEDIQDKMREEMEEVIGKHGGEITYDGLMQMTYMGQVLEENCRKNSAVAFLFRICTQDYNVPGTDVVIDKDTLLLIPSYAIHHDPEYYPNPDKFDPSRFSEENRNEIVPYTYLPFGGGPRGCIGVYLLVAAAFFEFITIFTYLWIRYVWMVLKIGLISTLRKHRIRLNAATPKKLSLRAYDLGFANKETVFLDVEKIL